MRSTPSFITVAGLKGSGKTTVVEALLRELVRRGLRVASAKSMRHGSLELEPEGADTRRHLAAGAEAVIAFAADEEAVFARRSSAGAGSRFEGWIPDGIDWIVCEGVLEGVPSDRVILCLERAGDFAEALAVRGIEARAVIAVSGIAAGRREGKAPTLDGPLLDAPLLDGLSHDAPLLDARDPADLASLADLVLGASARGR